MRGVGVALACSPAFCDLALARRAGPDPSSAASFARNFRRNRFQMSQETDCQFDEIRTDRLI